MSNMQVAPADEKRALLYGSYGAQADKWLHPDGSLTTLNGEIVAPPDEGRAQQYKRYAPRANKWAQPDGSIVAMDFGGGSGGGSGYGIPTGGTIAQVLAKKSDSDYDVEWKDAETGYLERVHSITQTLTAGVEATVMLPTSKITGLVTKVYANGALVGVEGVNAIASGNVLKFTPKQTVDNAEIEIFYSSPAGELPKNYQYVSVDFEIDAPDTTVAGAADVRGASEGAMFSFDWGDGTVELLACDSTLKLLASHTYENAGTYTVTITDEFGQMTGCFFNSQAPKVVSRVNRFEGTEITTLGNCFTNQPLDIAFAPGFRFKTPKVTSINNMFAATGITSLPDHIFDELVHCTNVGKLFDKGKIQVIQSGLFDTMPDITEAGVLARQCSDLHTVGAGLFKNKKKLTAATAIFQACPALVNVGDELFSGCESFINAQSAFENTGAFIVGANTFKGCVALTNAASLFYNSKIAGVPANLFVDCPEISNITALFRTASQITAIPDGLLDNQTKITTMNLAFNGMTSCTYIAPRLLDAFIDKVTDATSAFQNSNKFTTIVNDIITREMTALVSGNSVFYGCTMATGIGNDVIPLIPDTALHSGFFKTCTSLSDWVTPGIPAGWK